MSDETKSTGLDLNLRSRIAAALKAETERRGIYWIADFDFPFMADAVIAELGLREETAHAWSSYDRSSRATGRRWVTEWVGP